MCFVWLFFTFYPSVDWEESFPVGMMSKFLSRRGLGGSSHLKERITFPGAMPWRSLPTTCLPGSKMRRWAAAVNVIEITVKASFHASRRSQSCSEARGWNQGALRSWDWHGAIGCGHASWGHATVNKVCYVVSYVIFSICYPNGFLCKPIMLIYLSICPNHWQLNFYSNFPHTEGRQEWLKDLDLKVNSLSLQQKSSAVTLLKGMD